VDAQHSWQLPIELRKTMTKYNPNPSVLAMVPFVSVDNMMKIINTIGPGKMIAEIAEYVEEDFKRWERIWQGGFKPYLRLVRSHE